MYDVDHSSHWSELEDWMTKARELRRERVRNIVARLEQLGIVMDGDRVLAQAGKRTVGRPDVARALVQAGVVATMREAFSRFLRDGGPADIPAKSIGLGEALEIGRRIGARMALAHPHTVGGFAEALFRAYRSQGLTGIEAHYKGYTETEQARWLALAREWDLVSTAGSDFHGAQATPNIALGVALNQPHLSKLLHWLKIDLV